MDQRRKAYDIFPQLVISDEFMRRVTNKQEWTLVDPYEVRTQLGIELADTWGESFEEAYKLIEFEIGKKIKLYKKVSAIDLFKEIMRSQLETGMPYLAFKDTINRSNPNKHRGIIPSVNLCVAPETLVMTDKGEIAIAEIEGQTVNVWNGFEWSEVLIRKTGHNQKLITVTVEDSYGRIKSLDCTEYHEWYIVEDGIRKKVKTIDLKSGDPSIMYFIPSDIPVEGVIEPGTAFFTVKSIDDNGRIDDTFCFTEHKRHLGMFNGIVTGQCVESFSNVKSGEESHVCNLISLNLANIEPNELEYYCQTGVRILDNTIDITTPPFNDAKVHGDRYRTIGVGAMGLADWLAKNHLTYEHIPEISNLFEDIGYYCTNASMELAKERGAYAAFEGSEWSKGKLVNSKPVEWFQENASKPDRWIKLSEDIQTYGIRNSMITAIAPNTSSSLVQGCTASVLPVYSRFFYDKWAKGTVPIAPPFIEEDFWFYRENKNTPQEIVVNAVATIQQWIDTGISMELLFNLNQGIYFDGEPERCLSAKDIFDVLVLAWRKGCKAVYYVRTVQKDDFKDSEKGCSSCAN